MTTDRGNVAPRHSTRRPARVVLVCAAALAATLAITGVTAGAGQSRVDGTQRAKKPRTAATTTTTAAPTTTTVAPTTATTVGPTPTTTVALTTTTTVAPTTTSTVAPTTTTTTTKTIPPPTPSSPTFGVQFHGTWSSYTDAQRVAVLDKLAAAGVRSVRIDLGWASFEERGSGVLSSWYVKLSDSVVNAARARGMEVLATMHTTPAWANGGQATNVPPSDPAEFARFMRWAAEHFKGRVGAWEIWNEPNQEAFWAGRDPARYTALLKAAYPAVKAGDPGALVVMGGPAYNDTAWLQGAYVAGAKGSFDVMATHPYMARADLPPETPDNGSIWTLSHVAAVRALMVANGDGDKKIWFTEFGWSSHTNAAGTPNWGLGVTLDEQADYLTRAVTYTRANYPYVTRMFWYKERNSTNQGLQNDNYGLLTVDLVEKPAYRAVERLLATP